MSELKFKTNINCGGCVNSVTPYLDSIEGIEWFVDTEDKRKTLTISGDEIDQSLIVQKVEEAGFEIAPLKSRWFVI